MPHSNLLCTTAKVKYLNSISDHISLYNTLQWLPAAFRIKAKCIVTAYIEQFMYLTSCAFILSLRSCWSFISSFDSPNSSVQDLCGFCFLSFFMQYFLCLRQIKVFICKCKLKKTSEEKEKCCSKDSRPYLKMLFTELPVLDRLSLTVFVSRNQMKYCTWE